MKLPRSYQTIITLLAGCLLISCSQQSDDFESIFNGKDLTNWEGDTTFWSVRDGAIVGQTTPENPAPANTFIIWQGGKPANFEFRASFRLTGQNEKTYGNSGVQYRSRQIGESGYVVGGYQADMDLKGKYVGMLYEEKGRGLLMKPGEKIRVTAKEPDSDTKASIEVLSIESSTEEILAAYNIGDWNELTIIAEGNHLRHYLNGTLTADVLDDDPSGSAASGLIALQLHRGEPMTIEFKNIKLKTLP